MPATCSSSALIHRPVVSPPPSAPSPSGKPPRPLVPLVPADDAERFFLSFWLRMHRPKRGPIFVRSFKRVEWSEDGSPAKRFVWEVARWRTGGSVAPVFICWCIDAPIGLWWKHFADDAQAEQFFAQPASVVMAPRTTALH